MDTRTVQYVCLALLFGASQSFVDAANLDPDSGDVIVGSPSTVGKEMHFRLYTMARKKDCLYIDLDEGSYFIVSFQVLGGVGHTISAYINGPDGYRIATFNRVQEGVAEKKARYPNGSAYEVCLDNTFSSMTSKLVDAYIGYWKPADFVKYKADIEHFHLSANNTVHILDDIMMATIAMRKSAILYRHTSYHDVTRAASIQDTVQTTSIIFCCVITLTSLFQVFFLKYLFRYQTMNSNKGSKGT